MPTRMPTSRIHSRGRRATEPIRLLGGSENINSNRIAAVGTPPTTPFLTNYEVTVAAEPI